MSKETLINGATAEPWRLELHRAEDFTGHNARLVVSNLDSGETLLDEDFTLDYEPIFGLDYEDMHRAQVRAEEAIDAYEKENAA